ncbi:MAG: hypothetical protein GY914_01040, partial [Prochlorococcus sp.]|nr:hypothetical protein [Prochlorococcus sp.]
RRRVIRRLIRHRRRWRRCTRIYRRTVRGLTRLIAQRILQRRRHRDRVAFRWRRERRRDLTRRNITSIQRHRRGRRAITHRDHITHNRRAWKIYINIDVTRQFRRTDQTIIISILNDRHRRLIRRARINRQRARARRLITRRIRQRRRDRHRVTIRQLHRHTTVRCIARINRPVTRTINRYVLVGRSVNFNRQRVANDITRRRSTYNRRRVIRRLIRHRRRWRRCTRIYRRTVRGLTRLIAQRILQRRRHRDRV